MSSSPLSPKAWEILRNVDTPTVCNVIELFDVQPRTAGYMDGRIRSCFPEMKPMVGYASTATFRSAAPPRAGDAYGSLELQAAAFAKLPGPPVVVFQDLDSPAVAATFGEVMCATYKAFGAQGLITSGAGRDLEQVRALGFPVFTDGAICSHGYCQIFAIDVPVHVGGITVFPGDLLHGDANGVTTIPNAIAEEVAMAVPEFLKAEEEVLAYVKSGQTPTVEEYTVRRKRMVERIKALGESIRARKK